MENTTETPSQTKIIGQPLNVVPEGFAENLTIVAELGFSQDSEGRGLCATRFTGNTFNLQKVSTLAASFITAAVHSSTSVDPEKESAAKSTLVAEIERDLLHQLAYYKAKLNGEGSEAPAFLISAVLNKDNKVESFKAESTAAPNQKVSAATILMSMGAIYTHFMTRITKEGQAEFRAYFDEWAKKINDDAWLSELNEETVEEKAE
jgi:hypothetical protein